MLYLVAAGLSGAAVDIVLIWRTAPLLALVTAPFAGSLAAGCVGLALHWLRPHDELREEPDVAHVMDTDAMVAALRSAAELGRREPGRRVVPAVRDRRRRAG